MKLIVGLGNPGTKYAGTRHNVGFSVIVGLADKYNIELSEKKHKAIYGRGMIEGEKVILAMPQTFMNLSGESVRELVDYYKCDPSDVIVAYDDIDLAVGKLRIREKGSAGGHNGMKNIISHLGTQEFSSGVFYRYANINLAQLQENLGGASSPEMLTLVARPHGWSFPSGHTSSAFAAAFALWLQNRRLGVPALALAGFIGFTRMYLYVHFPTDILGGVALGLALGVCGSLLADKISNKWAKRSEVKRTV